MKVRGENTRIRGVGGEGEKGRREVKKIGREGAKMRVKLVFCNVVILRNILQYF